jgi:rhamnose transport system substrate-binding protein
MQIVINQSSSNQAVNQASTTQGGTMRKRITVGAIAVSVFGLAAGSSLTAGATTEPSDTGGSGDTAAADGTAAASGEAVALEPGLEFSSILLPKFTGIAVFDQANQGAQEAAAELGTEPAEFLGPTAENSIDGQIEIMTNAATQGVDAVMLSNNAGDQIGPAVEAATEAGVHVVTWDSPIPSGEGEDVFVAQVDFDETGQVMADMARSILGDDGGQLAILSASPDAANQNAWIEAFNEVMAGDDYSNIEIVDTVYGNDEPEESYSQALALVDQYPDLGLIMSPTTVGIAAAAKAMQDEGLCEDVKVSGLGLPDEMRTYTENGCAPEFALWSFVDLGYLTYYVAYGLATDQITAEEGVAFEAGRMGTYTIEADPTRDNGLRVLMGPFTVYNADNIGESSAPADTGAAADSGAGSDMATATTAGE